MINFAQPLWLLALLLIPAGWAWRFYWRKFGKTSLTGLNKFIDPVLQPHLLVRNGKKAQRDHNGWLYALLLACLSIALANPRWSYRDLDAYQSTASMVIMLDLATSMNATDISPSRIVRARQYIEDLINTSRGLKIGLIGFAGNAHLISPITDDIQTIKTYIPALDTDLTNVQGNSLHNAFKMAGELLAREPGEKKSILLISDGNITANDFSRELEMLNAQKIQVHVVGVGTKVGSPFKTNHGNLHKVQGKIVNSTLNEQTLKDIAKLGHGIYTEIGHTDFGLKTILVKAQQDQEDHIVAGKVRQWNDRYYWFLIPAVGIMLHLMRKRVLFIILTVLVVNGVLTNEVQASNIFKNADQQGQECYTEGNFSAAADKFKDPYRKGVALYRAGQFAEAEQQFSLSKRPEVRLDALYNTGNSQMQQKKWRAAINSYEAVLKDDPDNFAAQHNLEIAKKMLAQNDEQEENEDNCECNNKDKNKQNNDKQNKEQKQKQDQSKTQEQKDQDENCECNNKDKQSGNDKKNQDEDNSDVDQQGKNQNSQKQNQQNQQDLNETQEQQAQNNSAQKRQAELSQQQSGQLAEDEARVEQWLNRIDSDIKIFLKNKFYVEDVLSAQ